MEANRSRMRWTYEEFVRLPSEGSARHEIIDGELAVTPAPTSAHQIVVANLVMILGTFVRANDLGIVLPGPIDVLFGEGDYLEPDLVFVRADRNHLVSRRGIEGPPDLVVEIVSPATAHRDRGIKLERYRHFGVADYWIVDLDARTAEVCHFARDATAPHVVGADERLRWTPLPDGPSLEVDVVEFFPRV